MTALHPLVYLAGPIRGHSYDEVVDWRKEMAASLATVNIEALSPMRHKEYLVEEKDIEHEYAQWVLSTARAITTRDRYDATRCDLLFANLLFADRVSIGTVMEIAWADLARTPIVVAMNPASMHDHPMLRECAGWIVPSLAQALYVIRAVLLP